MSRSTNRACKKLANLSTRLIRKCIDYILGIPIHIFPVILFILQRFNIKWVAERTLQNAITIPCHHRRYASSYSKGSLSCASLTSNLCLL